MYWLWWVGAFGWGRIASQIIAEEGGVFAVLMEEEEVEG